MFFKIVEVALIFGVSTETVRRWIREKKLNTKDEGKRGKDGIDISFSELKQFIKKNTIFSDEDIQHSNEKTKKIKLSFSYFGNIDMKKKLMELEFIEKNWKNLSEEEQKKNYQEYFMQIEDYREFISIAQHELIQKERELIQYKKDLSELDDKTNSLQIVINGRKSDNNISNDNLNFKKGDNSTKNRTRNHINVLPGIVLLQNSIKSNSLNYSHKIKEKTKKDVQKEK